MCDKVLSEHFALITYNMTQCRLTEQNLVIISLSSEKPGPYLSHLNRKVKRLDHPQVHSERVFMPTTGVIIDTQSTLCIATPGVKPSFS